MNHDSANPLISVAIATYNGSHYVAEQIQSIINQTYRPIEIVVSDDCSTDETVTIVSSFQNTIPLSVRVNSTPLGYARNFEQAILHSNGQFIALCDQDDVWFPEKLETLMQRIGSHSLAFSDSVVVDEHLNTVHPSFKRHHRNIATSDTTFLQLFFKKCIYGNTMLFHCSLIPLSFPMPGASFKHDWWLPLVAVKLGGIVAVERPLLLYRQHSANAIGATDKPGTIRKFIRFLLSPAQREKRQERKRKFLHLLEEFHQFNFPLTSDEQNILDETEYVYQTHLSGSRTFRAIKLTWKNRSLYFSGSAHCLAEIIAYVIFKN